MENKKDNKVANILNPFTRQRLIQASTVGKPGSIERTLAIEEATKYAKNHHKNLFTEE